MYRKPKITINTSDWPTNYGCSGLEENKMLYKGEHIDRFGSECGFFFGVPGEPYIYRSLPWFGNYDINNKRNNDKIKKTFYRFYSQADKDINPEYDYHLYKVIQPFNVKTCGIKSAFGYPGGGTQYRSEINVKELIRQGLIKEVSWINSPLFDDFDVENVIGGKTKRRRQRRQRKQKTRRKK